MKNKLLICLLFGVLSACTRDTDIELLPESAQLVINAHFSPDPTWQISVTNSISTDTSPLRLRNISNAAVEIYEDGVFKGNAQYMPPLTSSFGSEFRAFYTWEYLPEPGKEYELRVTAPGYAPATAKDRIPPVAAPVANPAYLSFDASRENITVEVALTDADPEASWYHLLFYYRAIDQPDVKLPVRNYRADFAIASDANGIFLEYLGSNGLLFDDKLFENGSRQMLLDLEAIPVAFSPPGTFATGIYEIQAELRSVSAAYYDYYASSVRQFELSASPFVEPIRVFNNVQGGLGNFSGYQSTFSDWVVIR